MDKRKTFGPAAFRCELNKLLPGFKWTVHKSASATVLTATGTTSSGFNRLSTIEVSRIDRVETICYEAKSAGFGTRSLWLHTNCDQTLARALRGLQEHYQREAAKFSGAARALQSARQAGAEHLKKAALANKAGK